MPFTHSTPLLARLKRELPPSPPVPAILQTLACRQWFISYIEGCRARYGRRFTVYPIDMEPLVFLSDPNDLQAMIAAPPGALRSGEGPSLLAPLIGARSFMLCEGEEHRCGRNAVMPAFHRKVVQGNAEKVMETIEREVASWPLNTPFAIHRHLHALMLRVILKVILLEEDSLLDALHARLLGALSVTDSALLQMAQLRCLPGWRGRWRRFIERRAHADELIFAVIRRRRAEPGHGDLLDTLLAGRNSDGSPMGDSQVRDNLVSMVLAGHETTTAELAWTFQLLAHDARAQNCLLEEIDGGMEDRYMAATLNEALRHRPAFPFLIPRAVAEPIEIGGWIYRPPARLLGCIYLMHHDPEHYPEPWLFRPERFLDETRSARVWLPWGAGAKSCVGRHFALLEMKSVLRGVLSTRLVLPASDRVERERWRSAVLVPHAGSRVVLRRRSLGKRLRMHPATPSRYTVRRPAHKLSQNPT